MVKCEPGKHFFHSFQNGFVVQKAPELSIGLKGYRTFSFADRISEHFSEKVFQESSRSSKSSRTLSIFRRFRELVTRLKGLGTVYLFRIF